MKHLHLLSLAAVLAAASFASCNKEVNISTPPPHRNSLNDSEIRFSAGGLDVSVETRATPVTELATFNVLASTGSAGSESQAWAPVAVTKSGSTYLTGKYWPAADPSYHFYASNAALTFGATGSTVTADGSVDVVCAYLPDPSFGVQNTLTFNHIYARVGSLTVNTQTGYALSDVSATLKNAATGGTYNIFSGNGRTDGTGWSSLTGVGDSNFDEFSSSTSAPVSNNDKWVVPGTYTVSVTYTLTKGDWTDTFTKSGTVSIMAGKTNNISVTAIGGAANEIVFGMSITGWGDNPVPMTFASEQVNPHPFSVAASRTVKFTTANLMYDGSATNKWHLMEHPWSMVESNGSVSLDSSSQIGLFGWATSGYNSKNPWMTSTTSTDYGPALGSGDWTDDSDEWDWGVHNTIYDYSGTTLSNVRTLTNSEWSYLVSNANPCWSKINGVYGMLIFSDDYAHPAGLSAITQNWDGNDENVFTSAQFEQMSAAGAIFLPAAGYRYGSTVSVRGSNGGYWSSSVGNEELAYYLDFGSDGVYADYVNRCYGYSVRLVVDE